MKDTPCPFNTTDELMMAFIQEVSHSNPGPVTVDPGLYKVMSALWDLAFDRAEKGQGLTEFEKEAMLKVFEFGQNYVYESRYA